MNGYTYEGEFRNGLEHGKGRKVFSNGDIYEGSFECGKRHGAGKLHSANGIVDESIGGRECPSNGGANEGGVQERRYGYMYEGEFREGLKHGRGKMVLSNGNTYEGSFQYGKRQGSAKYTWANGDTYDGVFQDGAMTGEAEIVYENGRRHYKGRVLNGLFHGHGKLIVS